MIDIDKLIIEATKSQDNQRRDTYRLIKTEITRFKTKELKPGEVREEYNEETEQQLLKDMVTAREKAIEMYKNAKRDDLIAKEEQEIRYIKEFLPKDITKEEIENALKQWMADNNCAGGIPKGNMGDVMKWFKANMPDAKGRLVSEVVKEKLV